MCNELTPSERAEDFNIVHGDKPKVWQLACRWEHEEMNNVDTARELLLKGLHRHPKSAALYADSFRLELLMASKENSEDDKELQLKRAKIILDSGLKNISDVSFLIEMCSIANEFDFAQSFSNQLLTDLWENHSASTEAWDFIALCELEGRDLDNTFDWKSLKYDFVDVNSYPDNIANYCKVYETATSKIDCHEVCKSYIDNAIMLSTNETINSTMKLQILKRALMKGHMLAQLTEQHYRIWLELLCSDDSTGREEITHILEEACVNLPCSEYLWEERLKRHLSNPEDLFKEFKRARKALPKEKGASLWSIIMENTRDVDKLKKLHEESMSMNPTIVGKLKPQFLRLFYENGDIDIARAEYVSMVKAPPLVMDLHKIMLEIEENQKVLSVKHRRNCHELATQQFGKKDSQAWLDYIKFEFDSGHFDRCGLLYKRACASLDKEIVDKFITMYTMNNMK